MTRASPLAVAQSCPLDLELPNHWLTELPKEASNSSRFLCLLHTHRPLWHMFRAEWGDASTTTRNAMPALSPLGILAVY